MSFPALGLRRVGVDLVPEVERLPLQAGKRVQPRKTLPAFGPRVAIRSVMGNRKRGSE